MALRPHCDRCGAADVQVVSVLGADLCNGCVADARAFIAKPPVRQVDTKKMRTKQAVQLCLAKGAVSAADVAEMNGEPYRKAYHSLIGVAKAGKLVHLGRGVFELPRLAVAE